MNRICKKCKAEKDISQFSENKKCKGGREYRCKQCKKDQDKLRNANGTGWVKQREHCKNIINKLKSSGCQRCGFKEHTACIDFHHIDPSTKDHAIANAHLSVKTLEKELTKCARLCANCHRLFHTGSILDILTPITTEEFTEAASYVSCIS